MDILLRPFPRIHRRSKRAALYHGNDPATPHGHADHRHPPKPPVYPTVSPGRNRPPPPPPLFDSSRHRIPTRGPPNVHVTPQQLYTSAPQYQEQTPSNHQNSPGIPQPDVSHQSAHHKEQTALNQRNYPEVHQPAPSHQPSPTPKQTPFNRRRNYHEVLQSGSSRLHKTVFNKRNYDLTPTNTQTAAISEALTGTQFISNPRTPLETPKPVRPPPRRNNGGWTAFPEVHAPRVEVPPPRREQIHTVPRAPEPWEVPPHTATPPPPVYANPTPPAMPEVPRPPPKLSRPQPKVPRPPPKPPAPVKSAKPSKKPAPPKSIKEPHAVREAGESPKEFIHNEPALDLGYLLDVPPAQQGQGHEHGVYAHEQPSPGHEAGLHGHEAGVYGHETGAHGHEAGAHGHEASVHGHEAPVHGHEAGALGHEAGVHGNEASAHGHEAGVHGHEAAAHGHEAGLHGHEAAAHGHEAGVHGHEATMHGHENAVQGHEWGMHGHEAPVAGHEAGVHGHEAPMHGIEGAMNGNEAGVHGHEAANNAHDHIAPLLHEHSTPRQHEHVVPNVHETVAPHTHDLAPHHSDNMLAHATEPAHHVPNPHIPSQVAAKSSPPTLAPRPKPRKRQNVNRIQNKKKRFNPQKQRPGKRVPVPGKRLRQRKPTGASPNSQNQAAKPNVNGGVQKQNPVNEPTTAELSVQLEAQFMTMFDSWFQDKFQTSTRSPAVAHPGVITGSPVKLKPVIPNPNAAIKGEDLRAQLLKPNGRRPGMKVQPKKPTPSVASPHDPVNKAALFNEFMTMFKTKFKETVQPSPNPSPQPVPSVPKEATITPPRTPKPAARRERFDVITRKPKVTPPKVHHSAPSHTHLDASHAHPTQAPPNTTPAQTQTHLSTVLMYLDPDMITTTIAPVKPVRITRAPTTARPTIDPDLLADINEARSYRGLPALLPHQVDLRGNVKPYFRSLINGGRLPSNNVFSRGLHSHAGSHSHGYGSHADSIHAQHDAIHREAGHNLTPALHREIHRLLRQKGHNQRRNLFGIVPTRAPSPNHMIDPDLMADIMEAAQAGGAAAFGR